MTSDFGRPFPPSREPLGVRAQSPGARVVYAFDGFELDPAQGRVFRDGVPIRLDPRPYALLEILVRNAGRVLSKEELLAGVWRDVIVSDAALKSCVRHARRALGDTGRKARVITTVRGRGYRLAQVVSERLAPPNGLRHGAGSLPFVGREALLDPCWQRLREGGGVAIVHGEPGIGKSRFLAELAARAAERRVWPLTLRPIRSGDAPPLWPWLDALRDLSREDAATFARAARGLDRPLGLLLRDDFETRGVSTSSDAEVTRFEQFEALATLLRRLADENPLLLLFDDLQDADLDSTDLFLHVSRRLSGRSALVVGAVRDPSGAGSPHLAHALRELGREDATATLALQGLDLQAVTELLHSSGFDVDPDGVARLQRRTGGNPLFLRELLADAGDDPSSALPPGLLALIRDRLGRLPATARDVLEHLAQLGPGASTAVLARATGRSGAEVISALAAGREAGVAVELAGGELAFSHALYAEALAEELPPERRALVAGRLAEALEAQLGGAPGSRVGELARLFDVASSAAAAASDVHEKAARYGLHAARLASDALAWEQSASRYERAISHFREAGLAGSRLHGEALAQLATAHHRFRRIASAREASRQAFDVARTLGDARLLADAVLRSSYVGRGDREWIARYEEALAALGDSEPRLRSLVLGRLAAMLYYEGDLARADALTRESLSLAQQAGDEDTRAQAKLLRSFACAHPDGLAERRRHLREAAAVFDRTDLTHAWNCRFYGLGAELEAGDLESAERMRTELVDLLRRLGHAEPYTRATACARALFAGRYAEAERLLLAGGDLSDPEEPNQLVFAGTMLAELRFQQGRLDELAGVRAVVASQGRGYAEVPAVRAFFALVDLESGQRDEAAATLDALAAGGFEDFPVDFHLHTALSYLVEICAGLGDDARAELLYHRLAPYADRNVVFNMGILCRGSVSHYLGLAARTLGDLDLAEEHLEHALAAHERWGALPYEAHSRQALGEVLRERGMPGDRARARTLLHQARATATSLGMGLLIDRAQRSSREQ